MSKVVDVTAHGAVGDGIADDAPAFLSARTAALAFRHSHGVISAPANKYRQNSTYVYDRIPVIGSSSSVGDLAIPSGTILTGGMTDGSPIIMGTGQKHFQLQSLYILGHANCDGVKFVEAGVADSFQYIMRDLMIRLCDVGLDVNGFLGVLSNLYLKGNRIGGIFSNANNVSFHGGEFQGNEVAIRIKSGTGISFYGTSAEGNSSVGLDIEGGAGIGLFGTHNESTPVHMHVGSHPTVPVRNVTIYGGAFIGTSSKIIVDNVDGFKIVGSPFIQSAIEVTDKARNVDLGDYVSQVNLRGSEPQPFLDMGSDSPPLNWNPNPQFVGGLRGFSGVALKSVTAAEETAVVRAGAKSCLKLTNTTGQWWTRARVFLPNQAELAERIRGKRIHTMGWVYVPDIAGWNDGGMNGARVDISPTYRRDNRATGMGAVTQRWKVKNWVFTHQYLDVPSSGVLDNIGLELSPNFSDVLAPAGTYALFSDVAFFIEPSSLPFHGRYMQHSFAGGFDGPNMKIYADAVPTDPDLNYQVGDKVEMLNPTAFLGQVCTMAGTGSTAVHKPYGPFL